MQTIVALYIIEAEYVALSTSTRENVTKEHCWYLQTVRKGHNATKREQSDCSTNEEGGSKN